MNCLHILSSEYPPDVGGVADYTHQVAEALARAGEEIHVWCPAVREIREASGVHVHPVPGRFRPSDLRRLGARLDQFPPLRRILVQWVPHGFGYHSMNLWLCLWLATRARAGDRVELMVHEPFLAFRRGPLRHICMALVHRAMTMVLMWAASRVWVSIPAWESKLRPYALGRAVRIDWLPIPACVYQANGDAASLRQTFAHASQPVVGHFGSYGPEVAMLLEERLTGILDSDSRPVLVLIGAGSRPFRAALVDRHPSWAGRIHATGYVPLAALAGYLEACDLFLQPYPDGITSRRTSAMACLSVGRAVVTTSGHLTEPLWKESGAVALVDVSNSAGFAEAAVHLLRDRAERARVAESGRRLFDSQFDVAHTVAALLAA
jgi:glycosyltransferase involved in cell wall biosynthesis